MSIAPSGPVESTRIGTVLKGKYRLDSLLGSGGMGEVYRAQNMLMDRTVAIKVLRSELAADEQVVGRFMREARAANVVRHRHIVDVLDIDSDESGALFIVQEYLEGEDLAARLETGPLAASEALEILIAVSSAVGAAHARGLVHRDLKPDNVFLAMLDDERVPKVLDFGISKIPLVAETRPDSSPQSAHTNPRLTAAGIAMGTPAYMSPEQIRDPATVDARADVWAIGVMLYETVSGVLPFDGDTLAELFAQICTKEPVPLQRLADGVPPELSRVILRCLRPDPKERYADARELSRALVRVAEKSVRTTQLGATSAPPLGSAPPAASRPPPSSEPPPATPSGATRPAATPSSRTLSRRGARDPALAETQKQQAPVVFELELGERPPPRSFDRESGGPATSDRAQSLSGAPLSLSDAPRSLSGAPQSLSGASLPGGPLSSPVVSSRVSAPASAARRPGTPLAPAREDSAFVFRLLLGLVLGGVTAVGAGQLSAERILGLQRSLGASAFVPFLVAALLLLGAGVFIVVHAARQLSYSLFAAALSCFALTAFSGVVVALFAAPGLVPETPRKLLLTAGPWGAAALVASLALFGLLHGLELRREGPTLWSRLLLAAALLGFGAVLFLGRLAMRTPAELVALELSSAESKLAARAKQLGVMIEGARAVRGERAPALLTRSTRGGEAGAASVSR